MALKVFRFFNIGKANAEIERLEAELATAKAASPEDHSTKLSEAIASNETISAELTSAEADLVAANAKIESLTGEKNDLAGKLTAANNQASVYSTDLANQNTELSKLCVAANCLDLKLEAGATDEQKLEAASKIPFSDKLKAYRGAVNSAIAKTGAAPLEIPAAVPGANNTKPELKGRARMLAAMKIAK